MEKPLSKRERDEFEKHDAIVGEGLLYAFVAGNSLSIIQEGRLYREDYDTFEDYCMDRRDISRRRAYQLIDANVMRNELKDQGVAVLPENEYQVRELKRLLTPKERAEAWEDARGMCTERTQTPPPQSVVKRAVEAKLYELEPHTQRDEPLPQSKKPVPVEATPFDPTTSELSEGTAVIDIPPQPEATPVPIGPLLDGQVILDHFQCPICHSVYEFLEEYLVGAEEVPQSDQLNGKAKNAIRGQLERHFSAVSNIPMPMPKTEKQKGEARVRWWTPLREIAELANWNQGEAETLIEQSFKHLRSKGFLIEAPQSILKTATALAAGQTASAQSGRKKSGYELYKEMYQDD